MMDNFRIQEFDYKKRKRNLSNSASGVVSSTKYFPVFEEQNKEKIFKPLSKTKPLSTPLFSYSEVYWSYLINKYIDSETPIYQLAYCYDLSKDQPKYYEKGCIVDNVLEEGETLVNLLEFFRMYPDSLVNIDDYVNYCEVQYDYTPILESDFFRNNKNLSRKLSEQILCSILRRDDNYHYENVSLIFKDGKPIKIAPIIDLEFSQMFMYPDVPSCHERKFSAYDEGMFPIYRYDENKSYDENMDIFLKKYYEGSIYDDFDMYKNHLLMRNIKTIVTLHPDLAKEFVNKINQMKEEIKTFDIKFDSKFLTTFSSSDWEPTRMLFKENKKTTDDEYIKAQKRAESQRITLDVDKFNKNLKKEVIWNIDKITNVINLFMNINNQKYPDLKTYKNETLYQQIDRYPEEIMELLISASKNISEPKKVKRSISF